MAKYFESKIFTPGAKRKDVKILNFLWQILWIKNFHTWSEAKGFENSKLSMAKYFGS